LTAGALASAYSGRPAASRASSRLGWSSTRTIFPPLRRYTYAVLPWTSAPLVLPWPWWLATTRTACPRSRASSRSK